MAISLYSHNGKAYGAVLATLERKPLEPNGVLAKLWRA